MANAKPAQTASGNHVMQALILHQHQTAVKEAQTQLKETQEQLKKHQAEREAEKKKMELDKKLHEETKKELEKLKSQYDPKHVWEKKQSNRETMKRASLAKKDVKGKVQKLQKDHRASQKNAKPQSTRAKSTRPRKSM